MNKYTFIKGNNKYILNINHVKYCIGWNYQYKYKLKQIMKEYFSKIKESEYSLNNSGKSRILLNDKDLKEKRTLFYYIDDNYSLTDELKLTSKSLISKYLEVLMSRIDYYDTINTLNLLLESFGNELDHELLVSRFIAMTSKSLLKLMSPIFIKNDEQANEYDLEFEEKIIFQLEMLDYLSNNDAVNSYICLLEVPILTKKIKEILDNMNCTIVVLVTEYEVIPNYEDICIFDRYVVDYTDDETLYNIMLNKGILTLEEAKDNMRNIIDTGMFKLEKSINFK